MPRPRPQLLQGQTCVGEQFEAWFGSSGDDMASGATASTTVQPEEQPDVRASTGGGLELRDHAEEEADLLMAELVESKLESDEQLVKSSGGAAIGRGRYAKGKPVKKLAKGSGKSIKASTIDERLAKEGNETALGHDEQPAKGSEGSAEGVNEISAAILASGTTVEELLGWRRTDLADIERTIGKREVPEPYRATLQLRAADIRLAIAELEGLS